MGTGTKHGPDAGSRRLVTRIATLAAVVAVALAGGFVLMALSVGLPPWVPWLVADVAAAAAVVAAVGLRKHP